MFYILRKIFIQFFKIYIYIWYFILFFFFNIFYYINLKFLLFLFFNILFFFICWIMYLYIIEYTNEKISNFIFIFNLYYWFLKEMLLCIRNINILLKQVKFLIKDFFLFYLLYYYSSFNSSYFNFIKIYDYYRINFYYNVYFRYV